tara:strand:- start:98 stop:547 length:450 start_codon:yes stop_codon:yes gene_type:complete
MFYISHRGNINGANPTKENQPAYLETALGLGYDIEFDLWVINKKIFLGHDEPQYEITSEWLSGLPNNKLWVHCKNIDALELFKDLYNCFFHTDEDYVLTSNNFIWAYPGKETVNTINVLPEKFSVDININKTVGVCSDYIEKYKGQQKL